MKRTYVLHLTRLSLSLTAPWPHNTWLSSKSNPWKKRHSEADLPNWSLPTLLDGHLGWTVLNLQLALQQSNLHQANDQGRNQCCWSLRSNSGSDWAAVLQRVNVDKNISRLQETICSHRGDSPEGENQRAWVVSEVESAAGWDVVKEVEGAQYRHWSSSGTFDDTTGQGTEWAASRQPATGLCRHKHRGQSVPHRTPRPHHKSLTVKDYVPHNWPTHCQSTTNKLAQSNESLCSPMHFFLGQSISSCTVYAI